MISQTFGEWVRSRRQTLGLTREQLALRVGCSISALRKIEDDERRPSQQIAELIARGLGVPEEHSADFVKVARGEYGTERLASISGPAQGPGVPPSPAAPRSNLPVSPTPLIGRQQELADLHQLLGDPNCRMVTLVGPGGIGKTRLAIEAASQLQDAFADGVYFVDLAPVDSSRFIAPVIANSIGFVFLSASSADPREQLLSYLEGKRMLLLVDNLEHLLREPGIELFGDLLSGASNVKLLGTSRESLNLQGEWVFEVQGLPVPQDSDNAGLAPDTSVELFLQRARRAHVGFGATTRDYPAIVRICRLVDGMPLAIELAAAWVRTLNCEEIEHEIELGLDLLSSSARDLPARHRSMRAVFDHSWKLLPDDEQRALARLSVFRGSFGRQAAEQVAGAPLGLLSSLVSKSLVHRLETGRYDLHELIRQAAADYLEAEPDGGADARQQHYSFYLALAESAIPELKAQGQQQWLRQLEQEHDNFRAALSWSLDGGRGMAGMEDDSPMRLAGALRWFWKMRGHFVEGRSWLMKAIEQAGLELSSSLSGSRRTSDKRHADGPVRARALEALASLNSSLANLAVARSLAEQSAAISRESADKLGLANARMTEGEVLRWEGNAALSHTRLQEALTLYRELGDRWNAARALFRLGQYVSDFDGDAAGRAMLEESSTILEELGDTFIYDGVLAALGLIAVNAADYTAARAYFERSLAMARQLNDPGGTADALTNIGGILRVQGDYQGARSTLLQALQLYQQWGRGTWCADALCALAENEIAQMDYDGARLHLSEASPSSSASENRWLQVLIGYFEGWLAFHEGHLGRAVTQFEKTVELARESHYKPDLARSLVSLGRARRAQGEMERARVALMEGLRLYAESGSKLGVVVALEALAGLTIAEDSQRAAQMFGAAEAIRSAIGAPLPPADQPGYERDVAAVRARIGETVFVEAWRRGRAQPYELVASGMSASSNATTH